MYTRLIAATLFAVCVTCPVHAQTLPSTLTQTGTYDATVFGPGGGWGAGGIEFDPTGTYLYICDMNANTIVRTTVVRTSGKITGFAAPTIIATSTTSNWLDAGLTLSSIGTLLATGYNPYELEQYAPSTSSQTLTAMASSGLTGTTGGCEFSAATPLTPSRFLMTDYTNGGLYEVPLTKLANDTYSVGQARLLMNSPAGVEGFAEVPSGHFGNGRGMVIVNYSAAEVGLVALDQATGNPFTNATGDPHIVPVITGLFAPMDVEFDPLTGDMFVSDYGDGSTTTAIVQFAGTVSGIDGEFNLYGPGCPRGNGQVPTLSTQGALTRAGQPITFSMTNGPPSQNISFLAFGVVNVSGFEFPNTKCFVFPDPLIHVGYPTNQTGGAAFQTTLPLSALGVTLFTQAWGLSVGANYLNLTLSDAAVFLVSN